MKLTLGFSPCPNDTFIFDALVNKKIDTEGLSFDVVLEDVQTLNNYAKQNKLDISKISYGVLPLVLKDYTLLSSGGALGKGVGPLLITNEALDTTDINHSLVAIPGENTTAHMLFSLAFPNAVNKTFKVFHEIEDWLLQPNHSGTPHAGVIIHENRFTYQDKGLKKIIDLGEYWEHRLKVPIPLGGIVAKRSLGKNVATKVNRLIRKSLEFAFEHYPVITDYVKQHSQEMSESVMKQHIDLYVNNYSLELGNDGVQAVLEMLKVYQQLHPGTTLTTDNIFA